MGVRGLTTYIAQNADSYLEPFELHDCCLVIDGDSLASNLYKWKESGNSAYSGDYDRFYENVCDFFKLLKECNVKAYVLLDGGYEYKKLTQVKDRLRTKIGMAKFINPYDGVSYFPLMLREVFTNAVRDSGVELMRCDFEADDEIAALAKHLDCPVLSYDSDFFIHNVAYIPSVSLTMKVYEYTEYADGKVVTTNKSRKRNLKAYKKKKGMVVGNVTENDTKVEIHFKYLDCSVFTVENFISKVGINPDLLPLLASLLGNDYVSKYMFSKFIKQVTHRRISKRNSKQFQLVEALIRWLKTQSSLDGAITTILKKIEKEKHKKIRHLLNRGMSGYKSSKSQAIRYFGFVTEEDNETSNDDNSCSEEWSESECDDNETDMEEVDENDDDSEQEDENVNSSDNDNPEEQFDGNSDLPIPLNERNEKRKIPNWLQEKYSNALTSRFLQDLIHLRMYFNVPQIENFMLPDANLIAYPILKLIFSLLQQPEKPYFLYLSRTVRITQVHYTRFDCLDEDLPFDSSTNNMHLFELLFKSFERKVKTELFKAVEVLPPNWRLYMVSIVFWAHRSPRVTQLHVQTVVLGMLTVNLINRILNNIRSVDQFDKAYRKDIKKFKNSKKIKVLIPDKENLVNGILTNEEVNSTLVYANPDVFESMYGAVTKIDCIIALQNIVKYYSTAFTTRNKHTDQSSNVIHVFSELQAVVYNLNNLNVVINTPYESCRIEKFYNGTLLYNIFTCLKNRENVNHYIKFHLFKEANYLYEFYCWLLKFVSELTPTKWSSEMITKQRRKRKNKNKTKSMVNQEPDCDLIDDMNSVHSDDTDEFNDLNNRFSALLK